MAALGGYARRLHAGRAAADDQHLLARPAGRAVNSGMISRPSVAFTRHSSFLLRLRMSKQCRQPVQGRMSSEPALATLFGILGSASRRRVMPTKSRLPRAQVLLAQVLVEAAGRPHRDGDAGALARLGQRHGRALAARGSSRGPRGGRPGGSGIQEPVRLQEAAPVAVALGPAVDAVGHLADEHRHPRALVERRRQRVVVLGDVDERVHGEAGTAAPLGLGDDARAGSACGSRGSAARTRRRAGSRSRERNVLPWWQVPWLISTASKPALNARSAADAHRSIWSSISPLVMARQGRKSGPGSSSSRQRRGALDVAQLRVARQEAGGVPRSRVLQLDRHRAAVPVHRVGERVRSPR